MSTGSQEPDTPQGHPAWQEILDVIPESLHPLIQPKLADWDKRTQAKLQEVHGTYDPYKRFAESKIDPQVIEQSLYIANMLQSNPAEFVARAIENFNLEEYKQQEQQTTTDEDELVDYDGDDITKHPMFKQVLQQLEATNAKVTTWEQQQQQSQQQQQLEDYLDSLEEEHGEFDRLVVASLLANNIDGPQAVKQWQDTVNAAAAKLAGLTPEQLAQQQTQQVQQIQPDAPVVMGAAGTAGSGSPNEPVRMGNLSSGETQDLVLQMLEQAAKDGN